MITQRWDILFTPGGMGMSRLLEVRCYGLLMADDSMPKIGFVVQVEKGLVIDQDVGWISR